MKPLHPPLLRPLPHFSDPHLLQHSYFNETFFVEHTYSSSHGFRLKALSPSKLSFKQFLIIQGFLKIQKAPDWFQQNRQYLAEARGLKSTWLKSQCQACVKKGAESQQIEWATKIPLSKSYGLGLKICIPSWAKKLLTLQETSQTVLAPHSVVQWNPLLFCSPPLLLLHPQFVSLHLRTLCIE